MKQKNDYFKMMETQVSFSLKAAELLHKLLEDYKPEDADKNRVQMHRIEHDADEVRHEALNRLSREFITPIERDDILQLVQIIDDVTDAAARAFVRRRRRASWPRRRFFQRPRPREWSRRC